MPRQIEVSGKTVEQAIEKGLNELNLPLEKVSVTVIQEGGFLKRIKVLITEKLSEHEAAQGFVERLLTLMNLKFIVEAEQDEEAVRLSLIGTDSSTVTGSRGEVLDAIQILATQTVNKSKDRETFKRIIVDCDNFRGKRNEVIIQLAKNLETKVAKSRRPTRLEPMNSYERRLIHSTLQDSQTVETRSEGYGKDRYVIVSPKGMTPTAPATAKQKQQENSMSYGKESNSKTHKYVYRTKSKK